MRKSLQNTTSRLREKDNVVQGRERGHEIDAYAGMELDAYARQQVDNKDQTQQVLCVKEKKYKTKSNPT